MTVTEIKTSERRRAARARMVRLTGAIRRAMILAAVMVLGACSTSSEDPAKERDTSERTKAVDAETGLTGDSVRAKLNPATRTTRSGSSSDEPPAVLASLAQRKELVRRKINPIEERVDDLAQNLDRFGQALLLGDDRSAMAIFANEVETNGLSQDRVTDEAGASTQSGLLSAETIHYGSKMTILPGGKAFAEFSRALDAFQYIDGTRIKVISADPTQVPGQLFGTMKWSVVGLDKESGARLWLRTTMKMLVERVPNGRPGWAISSVRFEKTRRMTAKVEMFSEVSEAAGFRAGPPKPPPTSLNDMSQSFPGIAIYDVDGNGFVDVFMTKRHDVGLFLNDGGTFRVWRPDAAMRASMWSGSTAIPLFLDYDSDGDADLFIAGTGTMRLYQNQTGKDGVLRFVDVSKEAGVMHKAFAFSVAAGDVNKDGHTDIFVPSYNVWPRVIPDSWVHATNGTRNLLLMNQGDGTFREEAIQRGMKAKRWSFAAQMGDLDGDADLDIYVANDYGSGSTLYVNEGGQFSDRGEERGLLHYGGGMGVSIADYDNDGTLDLHLTNMSSTAGARIFARLSKEDLPQLEYFRRLTEGNAIFNGNGDGTFQERSATAGPFRAGWAWGGGFVDVDNNGWEDLYVPNGFISGASIHDT